MSYDEFSTKHELQQMGVDIFEPLDETEVKMAHLFEDFSSFVLKEEMELCQPHSKLSFCTIRMSTYYSVNL